MTTNPNTVVTGPNYAQVKAQDIVVDLPGQAQTAANTLGTILGGQVPTSIPTVGITAHAGGGQTNAFLLPSVINSVDTVATAADSVKLPLAQAGMRLVVVNTAANSMQVFGSGTDTINGVATATGVAQAATTTAEYICTVSSTTAVPAGKWVRNLSA